MTPEALPARQGVGFAAMCAAKLVMGGAVALAAWGGYEATVQGYFAGPEVGTQYNSSSSPAYQQAEQDAANHFRDGTYKLGASIITFVVALGADTVLFDRRQRRSSANKKPA